jgi:hypothetical protein
VLGDELRHPDRAALLVEVALRDAAAARTPLAARVTVEPGGADATLDLDAAATPAVTNATDNNDSVY